MPSAAIVSPTLLSAPVSWTRFSNFDAFVVFLKNGSMIRRLASLRWLQLGAVRPLHKYYQDAMTSCRPSHRTSLPSLGGTSGALVGSFLGGKCNRRGLELINRCLHPGCCRGNDRISQVPGEPQLSVCACSEPTPAGLQTPDPYSAATWPLQAEKQRLLAKGISKLNSMAFGLAVYASPSKLPNPTQNSLPAAGQALPDGLSTRKVPMKGFKVVSYISFPLPKLLVAIRPTSRTNASFATMSRKTNSRSPIWTLPRPRKPPFVTEVEPTRFTKVRRTKSAFVRWV